jgi:predicted permease
MVKQLVTSFLIIFISLATGYLIQLLVNKSILSLPFPLEKIRKFLQKSAILFFVPITYIGVYWTMDFHQIKLLLFPLLGIFNLILGGTIAILIARRIHLDNKDTGSFFCCGFFSNLINIGGLTCFLFLGEEGYKLVPLYTLLTQITYYAIGFSIAKYYSMKDKQQNQNIFDLKVMLKDAFILVGLASIFIGLSFNASGLVRPVFYTTIIYFFIPTSTILLLISIGLSMKFNKVRQYLKESILITGIKLLIVPAVMVSIGFLLGYHQINDGLPLKVILILSSAPVAFHSLIPPSLYGLNLDLANSCWVFTTLGLVLSLPILLFLINLM